MLSVLLTTEEGRQQLFKFRRQHREGRTSMNNSSKNDDKEEEKDITDKAEKEGQESKE